MRQIIAFLVALLLPLNCFGAIAHDADSASGFFSANTKTWAHVTGSGLINSVLVVGCGTDIQNVTGITYNTVAMTRAIGITTGEYAFIYYLINPASGSHNVVASLAGATNGVCGAATFQGVYAIRPIDATASANSATTNPSTSVTVLTANSWLMDTIFENGTTMTAPTTANGNSWSTFDAGGPSCGAGSYSGPVAAGAQSLAWTEATSATWARVIIALKPATGLAEMVTNPVTNIGKTTVTGNGNITTDGGFAVTDRGVCWATTVNPATGGTCASNGTGTGAFTASITGLTPNTFYYVRAYATNTTGTSYGDNAVFLTSTSPKITFGSGVGKIGFAGSGGKVSMQ